MFFVSLCYFRCKITKNFKNFKIFARFFAKFAHLGEFLYLCTVKRIEYIAPIDWMRGSLSGHQSLLYAGSQAYDIDDGDIIAADDYRPKLIAQVRDLHKPTRKRCFQVRTRSSVNMTVNYRQSVALLGGAGAIYSAIVRDKSSKIYTDCIGAIPVGYTLRSFLIPIIRAGLAAKDAIITITDGVQITNPWISSGTQTVQVPQTIIDKFAPILSN